MKTTDKMQVKETLEVDYTDLLGPVDQVMAKLQKYKDQGWEGIDVGALYWGRGAVYELYRYRDETTTEAAERAMKEEERRQKKMAQLEKLNKELGAS